MSRAFKVLRTLAITPGVRYPCAQSKLDITVGGVMTWSVLARTRRIGRGVLAGHYVGASADASVGVGIGAKALIGGSRRTTMLQPLSLSGRVGVNLAAGVTGLTPRFGERS